MFFGTKPTRLDRACCDLSIKKYSGILRVVRRRPAVVEDVRVFWRQLEARYVINFTCILQLLRFNIFNVLGYMLN